MPLSIRIAVDSGSDAAADTALDSVDDVVREADVAIDSGVDIGPEIAADAIDSAPVDAVADTRMDVPSTCSWKGFSGGSELRRGRQSMVGHDGRF